MISFSLSVFPSLFKNQNQYNMIATGMILPQSSSHIIYSEYQKKKKILLKYCFSYVIALNKNRT